MKHFVKQDFSGRHSEQRPISGRTCDISLMRMPIVNNNLLDLLITLVKASRKGTTLAKRNASTK